MAAPHRMNQDSFEGTCPGHASFERMIESMFERLGDRMAEMARMMAEQNKTNAEAVAKILENQSDRREICGRQNARLEALEAKVAAERSETLEARKEIWSAINKLSFYVFMGIGIVVALQALLVLVIKHMG